MVEPRHASSRFWRSTRRPDPVRRPVVLLLLSRVERSKPVQMIIQLCGAEAAQQPTWDDYVHTAADAGHCHLSAWRRVVERAYGLQPLYLWASEGGKVKGILPMVLLRDVSMRKSLVSLPFLDDGGICADDLTTAAALCEHALTLCQTHHADLLDLRHRRPSGLELTPHGSKVTFVLDLAAEAELVWGRLDPTVRNHIRKAVKCGLTASWTGREGLDAFYEPFAMNMRDLGSPVHSRGFFAEILEAFPDTARLILVRDGDHVIGGGLCFAFKDTVAVPWSSSRRDFRSKRPNHILYWEAIRWACKEGYRRFDFGRSSLGSGTYQFKKQWGACDEPLAWEAWQRSSRRSPVIESTRGPYTLVAEAWKFLPVALTTRLGPLLRKHISN